MQSFSLSAGRVTGLVSRRTLLAGGSIEAALPIRHGRGMIHCGARRILPYARRHLPRVG